MMHYNIYAKTFLFGCFFMLFSASLSAQQRDSTYVQLLNYDSIMAPDDEEVNMGFKTLKKSEMVGSSSTVKPQDFLKYDNTQWVRDALNGRLTGLKWSDNIRGQGSAMIVVDGIPGRSIDLLNMEEIEEITVLKDLNAAALYGSMAFNGVIVVTTKRGGNTKQFNVNASSGIKFPTRMPKYLDAAGYMDLYNEARANDGLPALYADADIQNYRSGTNPYRYPDVDFYNDEYFKTYASTTNVNADFSGGGNETRYYINLGFKSDRSLQNISDENDKGSNRFNVRGNIDFKVNDWIRSSIDVVSIIDRSRSTLTNMYNAGGSFRPNLYAPLLPLSAIDTTGNSQLTGILDAANQFNGYILGGSQAYRDNVPLADILAGGYQTNMARVSQVNNAIDFDLSAITEGLSAKSFVSFDFYNVHNLSVRNKYAVYEPTWNEDNKITDLVNVGDNDLKDQVESVRTDLFTIRYGFYGLLNYKKQLGENHHFDGTLLGFANNTYQKSEKQSSKNSHVALSLNYSYKDKLLVDLSSSYVNSVKLAEGNRGKFAPTLGLAYVLSEEPSIKESSWVDYFKLRTSMGVNYSDLGIPGYFLYDAIYEQNGGGYAWGDPDGGSFSNASTKIQLGQNYDLGHEKRTDYNLGFEALFLKKLWVETNVFRSIISDRVIRASTPYPAYYNSFRPYSNFNKDKYSGFEIGLNYSSQVGDLNLDLGVRALYTASERTKVDEVYEDEYQYRKGTPTDAIWGLESLGFFGVDDFNADGSLKAGIPSQYGNVKPGDLKYADMNSDGVVNDQDMVEIGNWTAPWSFGSDIRINYGAFTLFALLTAELGGEAILSGSYYRPQGDDMYSEVVLGRWTEATADTATYPRLSSIGNTNNFGKTSTFWMYDNSNFKVQRMQLTFDFPKKLVTKCKLQDASLFVAGSNLAEFSKNKKIRELQLGYGPLYRYYSMGLRMKF